MNARTKKILLFGGPVVLVVAKKLPAQQPLKLPLMAFGAVGTLMAAWETYVASTKRTAGN